MTPKAASLRFEPTSVLWGYLAKLDEVLRGREHCG